MQAFIAKDVVNALLKGGARKGIAAGFFVAASKCHDDVVVLLLGQGIDVKAKDDGALTAPVAAVMGGCAGTMQLLMSKRDRRKGE